MSEGLSPEMKAAHERTMAGATICWGEETHFDYLDPEGTAQAITLEDYAWGLASNRRWCGRTVDPRTGRLALYNVAQHTIHGAQMLLDDGHGVQAALWFLQHESDEVVWPDFVSPAKRLLSSDVRTIIDRSGAAIDAHLGFTPPSDNDLIKRYDIRMLNTERRDIVMSHRNRWAEMFDRLAQESGPSFAPFERRINCIWDPAVAAATWVDMHRTLVARL